MFKLTRETFQVSKEIWCVRQPSYLTCTYGVKTPRGVVLIDAGMDSDGRDVLALLDAMNEDLNDIAAIFLTHWHNDHAAGAQHIQKKSGCAVYFHGNEQPWLSRSTAHTGWRQTLSRHIPEWGLGILLIGLLGNAVPNAVQATAFVEEGNTLLGFEVIETPGHTPGHLSFYYPEAKALFAGDALAVIGTEVRAMAKWVTPDHDRAKTAMLKCLEKEILLLCPGHRHPLTHDVPAACTRFQESLKKDLPWPFWG